MKKGFVALLVSLLVIITGTSLGATTISYTAADLGSGQWQYQYSVINDSLASPIQEFTIYFSYDLADNLNIPLPKAGWDEQAFQPSPSLQIDGVYDALSLGGGIPVDGSESGFTVAFDWLGSGIPGSQYFEIWDPSDYSAPLDSGQTMAAAIAEPSVLLLLVSGCPTLLLRRRKLLT